MENMRIETTQAKKKTISTNTNNYRPSTATATTKEQNTSDSLILVPGSLARLPVPTAARDGILADGCHGVVAVLAERGVGGRGDGLLLLGKGEPPEAKPSAPVVAHGWCVSEWV